MNFPDTRSMSFVKYFLLYHTITIIWSILSVIFFCYPVLGSTTGKPKRHMGIYVYFAVFIAECFPLVYLARWILYPKNQTT